MPIKVALVRQEQTGGDGGAQAIIDLMLNTLSTHKTIDIRLICRKWRSEKPSDKKVIIDPAYKGRKEKQSSFNSAVLAHINQNDYDLIQSHERLNGCHIFRAGDGVHSTWLKQKSLRLNWLAKWWVSKDKYHRALLEEERQMFESSELKKVICNSFMIKKEIINNFAIDEEKVTVIYNGVDTDIYKPVNTDQKNNIRDSLKIPKEAYVYIFSGSGFERKNLLSTIEAFSKLGENCHLIILGRDKKEKKYLKMAKKLGCLNRSHFLGVQERKDMPAFYQASDVMVLPTLYDPFPNVILEALACGLPCITSSACGAVDIIPKHQCGAIIEPTDNDKLYEAMITYQNTEIRTKESSNARSTALLFTRKHMQEKLLALYQGLLNNT